MPFCETGLPVLAAITSLIATPVAALTAALAWLGWKRPPCDADVASALDQLLARDGAMLPQRVGGNPLDFQTSEHVLPAALGVGPTVLPGRVEIVRTVRAAIENGYRVRLRAFARVPHGRVLVRYTDVDLRSAA